MIEAIGDDPHLPVFDGHRACVQCYLHILNLICKSLLKQFDVHVVGKDDPREPDKDERVWIDLAEVLADQEDDMDLDVEEEEDDDDNEVDVMEEMSPEEQEKFKKEVQPVKVILAKVSTYDVHPG